MERKRLLTLLIAVCSFGFTQSQTLYSCNGIYSIRLPASLELQSSELNSVRRIPPQGKSTQIDISTPSNRIVFQQKGLNAEEKSAFNKYCRVIIEYFKEERNNSTYGRGDKIVVDKDLLYDVTEYSKESCAQSGTPFIKLISLEPLSINGFPVLYYSYKRKGWEGKQPPVIVNVFRIFNRYESVTLTFSYREAEREMWKSIHEDITKSFSFMKKY